MLIPLPLKRPAAAPAAWVRPSDWPAMPASAANEIDILAAVFDNGSNYCAVRATVSSGTYTVDWGDGTAPQTYTSGTTASYQYSYSASGLGALTAEGYKTAIAKITPTTGGANITALNLDVRNSAISVSTANPWLDLQITAAALTSLAIGGATGRPERLQRSRVLSIASVTNLSYCFQNCYALQSVTWPAGSLASVTDLSYCFNNCYALQSVTWPAGSLASVTSLSSSFNTCYALQSVTWPSSPSPATVTFTNGSAQIGQTAHGKKAGMAVVFSTTDSLPTNFTAGTTYYVIATGLTADIFEVSATNGGGAVTAGSAGSGTQSCALVPLGAVTNTTSVFSTCPSLAQIDNCALWVTFTVASCNLSGTNLDAIYTALPTTSGKTITVSSNVGTATDTPSIATGKGWSVTGS